MPQDKDSNTVGQALSFLRNAARIESSEKNENPLLRFMTDALTGAGCTILYASSPDIAPFRITFETAEGERMGIVAYAFLANNRETKGGHPTSIAFRSSMDRRTKDKSSNLHELWQDPMGSTQPSSWASIQSLDFLSEPTLSCTAPLYFSSRLNLSSPMRNRILKEGWIAWSDRSRESRSLSRYSLEHTFFVFALHTLLSARLSVRTKGIDS